MRNDLDVSVLIPTYNRAEGLRETLEAMTRVDRDGLSVEFVVIDNNSSDHTKAVVDSMTDRLPIRYIFESRTGKSCALNRALDDPGLAEITVFTDDDVSPCDNWLRAIISAAARWPDCSVFGGRIDSVWPDGKPPTWWSMKLGGEGWNLGGQDHGDRECVYPKGSFPAGPNTWIRREVIAAGYRYDEKIGPMGGVTIVGQDSLFVRQLAQDGYVLVYVPEAVVGHRIQHELVSSAGIRKRAWSLGRGGPHFGGVCQPQVLARHPVYWCLWRMAALGWACVRLGRASLHLSADLRLAASLEPINDIAYNLESLKIARDKRRR